MTEEQIYLTTEPIIPDRNVVVATRPEELEVPQQVDMEHALSPTKPSPGGLISIRVRSWAVNPETGLTRIEQLLDEANKLVLLKIMGGSALTQRIRRLERLNALWTAFAIVGWVLYIISVTLAYSLL